MENISMESININNRRELIMLKMIMRKEKHYVQLGVDKLVALSIVHSYIIENITIIIIPIDNIMDI